MSMLLIQAGAFFPLSAFAQQAPASQSVPHVITCISKKGERQVCPADAAAGVALLRSTGESSCLLGKTWGYDDAGIWVSDGCGGEFAVGSTSEASGGNDFVGTFEPYGQLRTHLAAFNDTAEVQDNATRVGINFKTRGNIKLFAGTEWGVNLVQSETQFNLSASGTGDFGVVRTETNPVFTARLGFIGTDFGPLGRVAIGKQNAVHYDVTSYTTDRFNVFGGQGTSTYVAGTDGGASGTGRADRVVNYRNTIFKILEVGIQGQFRGADSNGVGGSVQLTILPGVKVGGAYTHTYWSPTNQDLVRGLRGNADYIAIGTRIDWRILELGLVYSHQDNGDLVQVPIGNLNTPVAFDADGVELYARGGLGQIGLIGGFTYQGPDVKDPLLDPDFKTAYLILGAEWFVAARTAKIYTESKIDLDSVTATGGSGNSVFTIGFRYDFLWRISHK
jgi:predicted porin